MTKRKGIPVLSMNGEYGITRNLEFAMANSYIGEQVIYPRPLAFEITRMLSNRLIRPMHLFYYGTPDERLRKLFGYE